MDGLKKLVSGRLKVEAEGPHPDPELLAALAEDSLAERDRSDLLGHLAACGECREVLYLAQPDLVDHRQPVFVPPKPTRFAMRWATLAASVMIAAGVLIGNRRIFTQHPHEGARDGYSADQTVPQKPLVTGGQSAPVSNASNAKTGRAPEKHMTARPQASMQFDDSGEVHIAAPRARTDAGHTSPSGTGSMVSPVKATPAVWRLAPGGVVQDSVDSGSHWQAVPVGDGTRFRAINSLGDEVWVGGDGGALYHSPDSGRSWARVTPAASGKTLASEITGIKFSDLENGTVTTANGQVWSTSDDGKNWQLK